MEEFCPLCMKQGLKKKMKAIQINLEEAVWMCESETCVWPMDCKELEYISRKIGESWSCYWNTYKPNRSTVTASQSDWQSFITPPYTPKTEVSPASSSDTSFHSSYGVNHLHNVYFEESVSLLSATGNPTSNSANEKSMDTIENYRKSSESNIDTLLSTHNDEALMDITNPSNSNQFSVGRLKSCSLVPTNLESQVQVNTHKSRDSSNLIPNTKNLNTKVPCIVSIEKTNLVSVKGKNADKKLLLKESSLKSLTQEIGKNKISDISSNKEISKEKLLYDSGPQKSSLKPKTENLESKNFMKIEDSVVTPSSVEVRTVQIEGLPPVTLTYEVPLFLQEANNLVINECKGKMKLEADLKVSKKRDGEKFVQPLSKRSIMASKMYEKFSFSDLRKTKNFQKTEVDETQNSNNYEKGYKAKLPISSTKNSEIRTLEPVLKVEEIISIDQNLSDNTESVISDSQNTETSELITPSKVNRNLSQNFEDQKDNVISDLDSYLNDLIEKKDVVLYENMIDDLLSSFFY